LFILFSWIGSKLLIATFFTCPTCITGSRKLVLYSLHHAYCVMFPLQALLSTLTSSGSATTRPQQIVCYDFIIGILHTFFSLFSIFPRVHCKFQLLISFYRCFHKTGFRTFLIKNYLSSFHYRFLLHILPHQVKAQDLDQQYVITS